MLSTSAGIGLFLAFIGLQASEGLGVVTYDPSTLVTLGERSPAAAGLDLLGAKHLFLVLALHALVRTP